MMLTKYYLIVLIYLYAPVLMGQLVMDVDGNSYQEVSIGNQVWLQENLKVTHFNNGDSIPIIKMDSVWRNLSSAAYCNYDNDLGNVQSYGRLYNGYVAIDNRNVCPLNWHVPSMEDWNQLIDYLGGELLSGGKMNEQGNAHWIWTNGSATNSSGFTALPAGFRAGSGGLISGEFTSIRTMCVFWSSSVKIINPDSIFSLMVYPNDGGVKQVSVENKYGLPIRCVRDKPTSNRLNISDDLVNVYPNPTSGVVHIEGAILEGSSFIVELLTLDGKLLLSQESQNQLDLSKYSKQIFILKVINSDNIITKKIMLF